MPTRDTAEKIQELISSKAELLLVEYLHPGEEALRVCLNNDKITWNDYTWIPAVFSTDNLKVDKDAEVPDVSLQFADITQEIVPIVREYDGGVDAVVNLYIINSSQLDTDVYDEMYALNTTGCDIENGLWVTLKLGTTPLSKKRCPTDRYLKDVCRYKKFKGTRCAYTGAQTQCNRTYTRCVELGNGLRYGAFPGTGTGGYYA